MCTFHTRKYSKKRVTMYTASLLLPKAITGPVLIFSDDTRSFSDTIGKKNNSGLQNKKTLNNINYSSHIKYAAYRID